MAYSDFTLERACAAFELDLRDGADLFGAAPSVAPSITLTAMLDDSVPLATSIDTEKARSEMIVAPILIEMRKRMDRRISLFSGINFDVDRGRGLNGTCDFLIGNSPVQIFLKAPVMAVVEAKNDDINSGLGPCAAAMVACRIFHERDGGNSPVIHGLVTTGSVWKFLRLEGARLAIDGPEYDLDQLAKILGILLHCCVGGPLPATVPLSETSPR
jgi:hypothetical protein